MVSIYQIKSRKYHLKFSLFLTFLISENFFSLLFKKSSSHNIFYSSLDKMNDFVMLSELKKPKICIKILCLWFEKCYDFGSYCKMILADTTVRSIHYHLLIYINCLRNPNFDNFLYFFVSRIVKSKPPFLQPTLSKSMHIGYKMVIISFQFWCSWSWISYQKHRPYLPDHLYL